MSTDNRLIGIFGGTFDPIHRAHLNVAATLKKRFNMKELRLIPSYIPPHRSTTATAQDRLKMIQLALMDYPELTVDDREIQRAGLSYAVDTLTSIRTEIGAQEPLCFILGADAFSNFNQWKNWKQILKLCHLIVVNRPGFLLPNAAWLHELLEEKKAKDPEQLVNNAAGYIYLEQLPPSPISATQVRAKHFDSSETSEIPVRIRDYIKKHKLYSHHAD